MNSLLLCALLLAAPWPGNPRAAPGPDQPAFAVEEGDFVVKDFKFHSGESLALLKLHYRTLGKPVRDAKGRVNNAVMVLHGTGGSGAQFLSPQFARELYGPGQPLDIGR